MKMSTRLPSLYKGHRTGRRRWGQKEHFTRELWPYPWPLMVFQIVKTRSKLNQWWQAQPWRYSLNSFFFFFFLISIYSITVTVIDLILYNLTAIWGDSVVITTLFQQLRVHHDQLCCYTSSPFDTFLFVEFHLQVCIFRKVIIPFWTYNQSNY